MQPIKSVIKALDILQLFAANKEGMALGDIAKALNLNEATVSHIVSTLVTQGFLKQRAKKGKYYLGVRFLDISGTINDNPKSVCGAMTYLNELSHLVNDSISLTLWSGSDILFSRALVYFTEYIKVLPQDWKVMPLHCMCLGKIILSSMSDDDLNKYFKNKHLEKFTPNTIVDIDRLKNHISKVRREGLAIEDEEVRLGMRGIAARIVDSNREPVGAIHLLGSSARLTYSKLEKITPSIKLCALKISKELGYKG